MGPNEYWQNAVENELRNLKDFSAAQSLNQLAVQSQLNYDLPSRVQSQDGPTTTGELIWIRLTEKATDTSGQIYYSWRRQVKHMTGNGYSWVDNGDSGTTDFYPATGLNNDDCSVTDNKRYPARWNSDTSQWIFFSSKQATASSSMFRWNGQVWMYCNILSAPTINTTYSSNVTADTASLNAAIAVLTSRHGYAPDGTNTSGNQNTRIFLHSPTLNANYTVLYHNRNSGSGYWWEMNSTVNSCVSTYVTGVKQYSWVSVFPEGVGNYNGSYSSYKLLDNIAAGSFMPNSGFRYDMNGYDSSGLLNIKWDEADPAYPDLTTSYDASSNLKTWQVSTYKQVSFKSFYANGTTKPQNNCITLTRVIESNGTVNANNPYIYNYGPSMSNVSHYTFPAVVSCYPTTNIDGGNGTISVAWGNLTLATSNITNANGPLTPP